MLVVPCNTVQGLPAVRWEGLKEFHRFCTLPILFSQSLILCVTAKNESSLVGAADVFHRIGAHEPAARNMVVFAPTVLFFLAASSCGSANVKAPM